MVEPARVNPKLLDSIQKRGKPLDLDDFKQSLIDLFDDVLRGQHIQDIEKQGKIARLRAKILIELKDL